MCRAFLMYGKAKKFPYLLTYFVNSFNNGNTDGYFLGISDKVNIRTMSFAELLNFMDNNRELIDNEELVYGHARLATNAVCEDNIHGWNLNGFYCFHNGINDIKDDENDNDSWDFFKYVFRGQCKTSVVWERFIDEVNDRGNGAYFMVNPSRNIIMIAGTTINVNIHLINKNLVLFNSNDDIHSFDEKLMVKRKHVYEIFGLEFYETRDSPLRYDKPDISSDIKAELDYEALCIYRDEETDSFQSLSMGLIRGYKYNNYHREYGKKNGWGHY